MAAILLRSFTSARRLLFFLVGVFITLVLLRTPTAPIFAPGTPTHPQVDNTNPRSRLPEAFQDFLQWDWPVNSPAHYPPYDGYDTRDYDPNRWEAFEQNTGLYINGTLRNLASAVSRPFTPYPDYGGQEYKSRWMGSYVPCIGPSGSPIDDSAADTIHAYPGLPEGFPNAAIGSWEAIGIDEQVCFDRYSRLGPYGLGTSDGSGARDMSGVRWGALQDACLAKNSERYEDSSIPDLQPGMRDADYVPERPARDEARSHSHRGKSYKARSAVLIRTWDNYEYQDNDIQAIRSLVSELSLSSGGEYHVFLFVNVKDLDEPIFTDEEAYRRKLEESVPLELRDLAILWTEKVCQQWYPKIGEWSVYWQQFMPLQWFSRTHPEFEYVWNWEMDARYIGHHYQFVEKIADFAKRQPRKYLWERNSRFYIPTLHGTWDQFFDASNALIEASKSQQETVWGPQQWSSEQGTYGKKPPHKEATDSFTWGVGEEADFITLLPMWDPRETWWAYRDRLFNYPTSDKSSEERPYPHVPRRVFINTLVRFSKSLLHAMHYENLAGLSMASEMWPASIALQHGFKAVYAPHPIWQSHVWNPEYMELVFNADGWGAGSMPGHNIDDGRGVGYDRQLEIEGRVQPGTGPNREGRPARWSQERDCPYNPDREHNFAGWSWYFWSDFPRVIYWRWLGWKAGFSIVTIDETKVDDELGIVGGEEWENEYGRMCLPSMLLHPVKNVKPPPD